MGKVSGFALDAALHALAKDLVEMKKGGVAIDVDKTIANWNEKHKLANSTAELQHDLSLFINVEEERQLKSLSATGLVTYKADALIEKSKQIAKNFNGKPDLDPKKT